MIFVHCLRQCNNLLHHPSSSIQLAMQQQLQMQPQLMQSAQLPMTNNDNQAVPQAGNDPNMQLQNTFMGNGGGMNLQGMMGGMGMPQMGMMNPFQFQQQQQQLPTGGDDSNNNDDEGGNNDE